MIAARQRPLSGISVAVAVAGGVWRLLRAGKLIQQLDPAPAVEPVGERVDRPLGRSPRLNHETVEIRRLDKRILVSAVGRGQGVVVVVVGDRVVDRSVETETADDGQEGRSWLTRP